MSRAAPPGAAFDFAVAACLVATGASWLRGGKYVYSEPDEGPAAGNAATAGAAAPVGGAGPVTRCTSQLA